MFELKNVTKTYFTEGGKVDALKNVSMTFPLRGLVFILGKSGSGKTTLLQLLGGLDKPTDGGVFFLLQSLSSMDEKQLAAYRAKEIGFVFQQKNVFSSLTVRENIAFCAREEIENIAKRLEIEELLDRKINEISGGQLQRVAIARALAQGAKVLLCDEPTGNLDEATGKEIFTLLKEVSKDKLVVVVSHDEKSAETFGDSIHRLSSGELQEQSAPRQTAPPPFTEDDAQKSVSRESVKTRYPYANKIGIAAFWKSKARGIVAVLIAFFTLCAMLLSLVTFPVTQVGMEGNFLSSHKEEFPSFVAWGDNYLTDGETELIQNNATALFITGYSDLVAEDLETLESFGFTTLTECETLNGSNFYLTSADLTQKDGVADYFGLSFDISYTNANGAYVTETYYDCIIIDGEEIPVVDCTLTAEEAVGYSFKFYVRELMENVTTYDEVAGAMQNTKAVTLGGVLDYPWKKTDDGSLYAFVNYVFSFENAKSYIGAVILSDSVKDLSDFVENLSLTNLIPQTQTTISPTFEQVFREAYSKANTVKVVSQVFFVVLLAVLLIFMLHLITVTIRSQKREIALMRALGMQKKNVNFSYFLGTLTFVLPVLIVVLILSWPVCLLLNALFGVAFLGFSVSVVTLYPLLFVFLVLLAAGMQAVTLGAAFLSLHKINLAEVLREG